MLHGDNHLAVSRLETNLGATLQKETQMRPNVGRASWFARPCNLGQDFVTWDDIYSPLDRSVPG